jgi:hypothetical protein
MDRLTRADQDQHAFAMVFDAPVEKTPSAHTYTHPPGPTDRATLPLQRQRGDHRRRRIRRVLAQQGRQRLLKSPVEMPRKWSAGNGVSKPQSQNGRAKPNSLAITGHPTVSNLRPRTSTGPIPVWIVRAGPCRMTRARPSASFKSFIVARNVSTSISTACARSCRAPARRIPTTVINPA